MKIISWNVNGLRACVKHGLVDYLLAADADVIALQETKAAAPIADFAVPGYGVAWNNGERRGTWGYSGTACLYKQEPLAVTCGADNEYLNSEGRLMTLEYPSFYFLNVYVPNSFNRLSRKYFRGDWDAAFRDYVYDLQMDKPVVIGGDFNVAHAYIDVYPENQRNVEDPPGFTPEDQSAFTDLLGLGLADVYRELHPEQAGGYTWCCKRFDSRERNLGRRLDYFLVSRKLLKKVKGCEIRADVHGSDHAPIELKIKSL